MNFVNIAVDKRELGSKGYLNSLRTSGKVPGVLHGAKLFTQPVIVDSSELKKALSTSAGRNVLLSLQLDGEEKTAMIENLQNDFLREGVYIHVDLKLISLDEKISVNIPVLLTGHEDRVSDDGVVSQPLHEIEILSKPTEIPESIKVDISGLAIGDSILLKDVTLPEGCDVVTDLHEMVVSIMAPRIAEEETEAADEEAAEPALVGEEASDEENTSAEA